MYLHDYHMHSTRSSDGVSSMLEMCKQAVAVGLKEIAFTDHFEPTLGNESYTFYDSYKSLLEIRRCRSIFKNQLKIRFGIELGQPHYFSFTSHKIVNSMNYDYVLASAHKFKNGVDVAELDLDKVKLDDLCENYLKELKALAGFNNFDCVGHLDLIKRYGANHYLKKITLASKEDLLKEVFQLLIEKGKGIEINTSGLRQAPGETLPGLDVLSLYRKLGGEIITLGSDAHSHTDVGKGIEKAWEMAKEAGFKYVTTFENRKPIWIPLYKENSSLRTG